MKLELSDEWEGASAPSMPSAASSPPASAVGAPGAVPSPAAPVGAPGAVPSPAAPVGAPGAVPSPASAPHGTKLDGTPRRSPAGRKPKRGAATRSKSAAAPPDPARDLRPVTGSRIPVGQHADPYAALTRSVDDQRRIVAQIRAAHPDAKVGDPVDPRTTVVTMRETALFSGRMASRPARATYVLLADLTECTYQPEPEAWDELGDAWAELSRVVYPQITPANQAAIVALVTTISVFLPILFAAVRKWQAGRGAPS